MSSYRDRKLEFFVVAIVLGVLALFLLNALERVQGEIEEAAVQSEVSALRVELLDRLAHRAAFGGPMPEGKNPVIWAGRAPAGYVGERDGAPADVGVWYYDKSEDALVYRSRHAREMRFRLVREGGRDKASAVLAGVGLVRLEDRSSVK